MNESGLEGRRTEKNTGTKRLKVSKPGLSQLPGGETWTGFRKEAVRERRYKTEDREQAPKKIFKKFEKRA